MLEIHVFKKMKALQLYLNKWMVSWLGTCASYDVRQISSIVYGPIPCNQARKSNAKCTLESLPVC